MYNTILSRQLQEVFQELVKAKPDAIAIQDSVKQLTYSELSSAAERLKEIHNLETRENLEFGLFIKPSMEYIVSFITILSNGHRVVPINPELPQKRITQIMEAASFDALFTAEKLIPDFAIHSGIPVFSVSFENDSLLSHELSSGSVERITEHKKGTGAYTIFTSGTTGEPKGICGSEKGLMHFVQWEIECFQLKGLNVAMLTNIGFDVSFREILVPLMSGGTLHIPNQNTLKNPVELLNWMKSRNIEVIHSVPSLIRVLVEAVTEHQLDALKFIFSAGEALYWEDVKQIRGKIGGVRIINLYGPSETTLAKLYFDVSEEEQKETGIVPLGRPIDSEVEAFVSADGETSVVDGEKGELIIRTEYASHGYLNDDALNTEKFALLTTVVGTNKTQFKTGDLVKKEDGVFHYFGRVDYQCKIDGNRVELLEVESILRKLDVIENCAVVLESKRDKSNEIIAFVHSNKNVTSNDVIEALRAYLPEYSLPKHVSFVSTFPLNQNGKLDRRALLKIWHNTKNELDSAQVASEEASLTQLGKEILGILQSILTSESISIEKTFIELGGSSLNAIQLITAVYKEYNFLLEVPFILGNPLREVIRLVSNSVSPTEETEEVLQDHPKETQFNLSPFQEQLLYMSNFSTDANVAYNVFEAYKVEAELDIERLRTTFIEAVEQHTIFRTNYTVEEGNTKQHIREMNTDNLVHVSHGESEEEIFENFKQLARTPFDLELDDLMIQFYIQSTDKHVSYLAFKVHHIAVDAWALQNLRNQIIDTYLGFEVEKKSVTQYSDFVISYQEYVDSNRFEADARYWLNCFAQKSDFNSPTEFVRPKNVGFKGGIETIVLRDELSDRFTQLAKEQGMTTFMLFNALTSIPLGSYSKTSEVVLGTPVSLRDVRGDLNDAMGYFLNMLPLRIPVNGENTIEKHLNDTKNSMLTGYEHKLYPFQQLVGQLDYGFQTNHNPVFDIMIVELDYVASNSEEESVVSLLQTNDFSSKFDLTFGLIKRGAKLSISLEYNSDLYSKEGAKKILSDLRNVMESATTNSQKLLRSISGDLRFEPTNEREESSDAIIESATTTVVDTEVDDFISSILKNFVDDFDPMVNFFEQGLTSTQSLMFITQINRKFDVKVKIIDLWNHHFKQDLVAYVSSLLTKKHI